MHCFFYFGKYAKQMIVKIAILGDFNPIYETHHRLNESIRDVQNFLNRTIQFDWITTDTFDPIVVFENQDYKGLWIAPGSPYKDMVNALNTISYARVNNIPTLGNCGGFQHMLIEFAKNVCGLENADHEETNPDSPEILIKRLSCSLKGEQESLRIIDKSSILYKTYKKKKIEGKYFCSYGLNEEYMAPLKSHGINFTSVSEDGNYRSFEIDAHPFYVGTLFQPALSSTKENSNPMIIRFVEQSLGIKNHI